MDESDLFGSDDEGGIDGDISAKPSRPEISESASLVDKLGASEEKDQHMDVDEENLDAANEDKITRRAADVDEEEEGEFDDYRRRTEPKGGSQNDLDDLFGESEAISEPTAVKPALTRSRLTMPEKVPFPSEALKVFVKLPKLVKMQSSCADEDSPATDELGATLIQWRYKRDANGRVMRNLNGEALRESNARLVKLSNGEHKLVVGDMLFSVKMHPVDNR
jgi:hypothetical protein